MAVRKSSYEALEGGVTVIGEGIQIRGRIEGEEDLRIHGAVEGSISLTETLYVESGGVVQAKVEARDVVVSGIVIGDVNAGNSITLNAGAKLVGNITAPRVIIADGAAFRGDVSMGAMPITAPVRVSTGAAVRRSGTARSAAPAAAPQTATKPRPITAGRAVVADASKPRPAPRPQRHGDDDDEATVVIKHANLRKGEVPADLARDAEEVTRPTIRPAAPKKKELKQPARARVPARGKRRVARR